MKTEKSDYFKPKHQVEVETERDTFILSLCAVRNLPYEEVKRAVEGLDNQHIKLLAIIGGVGNSREIIDALEKLEKLKSA